MHLKNLFKLASLTPGRRILALRNTRKEAAELRLTEVVALAGEAIKHDLMTRGINMRWIAARTGRGVHGPEMSELAALADRLVVGVRDGAQLFAIGADSDTVVEVENFLDEMFPAGVYAVTSLPYVEEAAEIERLVGLLQGRFAAQVARFQLTHLVERLASLVSEYRNALYANQGIDFATVRAARDKGHRLLLQIVAVIAGTYPLDTPEHEAARARLLGPILAQEAAYRAHYRRDRRPAPDIDPDTGEISEPDDDPASEPDDDPASEPDDDPALESPAPALLSE